MPVYTNIEDLRRRYVRRTPKMFYDYAESGSWTEQTFRENTSDFQHIHLKQRVAVDMAGRSTKSQMIGEDVAMPVALAPVGLTGMQSADGEIKAARAAEKFGVPFTLSTMSICSIEDVAEHTTKPFWFQVYTLKDDDFMRRLIERAKAAKCSAIVVTVDLQLLYADAFAMTDDLQQAQKHFKKAQQLFAAHPDSLLEPALATRMNEQQWSLYRTMTYQQQLPDSSTFSAMYYRTKIRSLRKAMEKQRWMLMEEYANQLVNMPFQHRYVEDYQRLLHLLGFNGDITLAWQILEQVSSLDLRERNKEQLQEERAWLSFLSSQKNN